MTYIISCHSLFQEHGKLSATASLGLIHMWDVDGGLIPIDKSVKILTINRNKNITYIKNLIQIFLIRLKTKLNIDRLIVEKDPHIIKNLFFQYCKFWLLM